MRRLKIVELKSERGVVSWRNERIIPDWAILLVSEALWGGNSWVPLGIGPAWALDFSDAGALVNGGFDEEYGYPSAVCYQREEEDIGSREKSGHAGDASSFPVYLRSE